MRQHATHLPTAQSTPHRRVSGALALLAFALAAASGSVAVFAQTATTPPPDVPATRGTVDLSGFNAAIGSARPPVLGPSATPQGTAGPPGAVPGGVATGRPAAEPPPPRKPPTVAELAAEARARAAAAQGGNRPGAAPPPQPPMPPTPPAPTPTPTPAPALAPAAPAAFTPRSNAAAAPAAPAETAGPAAPAADPAGTRPSGPRLVSPARPPVGDGRRSGPTEAETPDGADPPAAAPQRAASGEASAAKNPTAARTNRPAPAPGAPAGRPGGAPPAGVGGDESLQHVAEKLLAAMAEVNERQRLEAEKARAQAAAQKKGTPPAKDAKKAGQRPAEKAQPKKDPAP